MRMSATHAAVSAPVSASALAPLLAAIGGSAVVVGSCLPWLSYFAGLVPLRGLTGINGRLMLVAGGVGLLTALGLAWRAAPRVRATARSAAGVLGLIVVAAAVWLLEGVRELTRVQASNAMLAPRPGIGLVIVLAGGALLLLSAIPTPSAPPVSKEGPREA